MIQSQTKKNGNCLKLLNCLSYQTWETSNLFNEKYLGKNLKYETVAKIVKKCLDWQ